MKYSEFKRLMENKGFGVSVSSSENWWRVKNGMFVVASVYLKSTEVFDTNSMAFVELDRTTRRFVAQKCMELAFTNLEDRKEEEKFKLKQKGVSEKYLMWMPASNQYITSPRPFSNAEFIFTQSEIDNMPECYKHPAVWEKIKVESDE